MYQQQTAFEIIVGKHMYQQQTAFENIVGKKEIARNEQFLFFPQRFLLNQKVVSPFLNIYGIMSLFAVKLEEL